MTVYTYGHEYPISSVQHTSDEYDIYLSRNRESGDFFRLMCVKNKELYPDIVSWLASEVDSDVFTDYVESFLFEEELYIVMKYVQSTTLKSKLETEALSLRARLELARAILERAVLLSIPDYFISKCFKPENIIVASDLTVKFNYPIDDIGGTRECNAISAAESLLSIIFEQEIERKVPDELIEFFDDLPELYGADMIELYDRYYSMLTAYIDRDAEEEEPKSFWYLTWEKIKKILSKLKVAIMFLLLAAAIAYMVFTIYNSGSSKKPAPTFDRIGTVDIDKGR